VDDDVRILTIVETHLRGECDVHIAENAKAAEAVLERVPVQVIVCDEEMPGEKGLAFLIRTRRLYPRLQRILLTGHSEPGLLLDAINKAGVSSYLVKPVGLGELRNAVRLALADYAEACRLRDVEMENAQLHANLANESGLARQRLTFVGRLLLLGSAGVAGMMLTALLLGVIVLVLLYFLKSSFGFDLLPDFHFWRF
jgi:two-component system, NtrC family, response regulator HupR/HoxA